MKPAASNDALDDSRQCRQIQLADVFPVLTEVLASGGEFTLTITGTSMLPTLHGGRDRVSLVAPPEKLRKHDLPLYRRANGQFVLHRVVAVANDGSYTCCGDHQWILEKNVQHTQIIGLVKSIERKGKRFSAENSKPYLLWVRFWVWIRPLRHVILGVCGRIYRFFSKLFKRK